MRSSPTGWGGREAGKGEPAWLAETAVTRPDPSVREGLKRGLDRTDREPDHLLVGRVWEGVGGEFLMRVEPHAFVRVAIVGEHAAVGGVFPRVAVVCPGARVPQVAPVIVGGVSAGGAAGADAV